jgi:ankyrin repeat protein
MPDTNYSPENTNTPRYGDSNEQVLIASHKHPSLIHGYTKLNKQSQLHADNGAFDELDNQHKLTTYIATDDAASFMSQLESIKFDMRMMHFVCRNAGPNLIKIIPELLKRLPEDPLSNGIPLLHFAVLENKPGVVKALLDGGCAVDSTDRDGHTPLHHAVMDSNTDLVNLLIQNKCNINAVNNDGNTPLIIAVSNNDTDIVDMLLKQKCIVEMSNKDGDTALNIASNLGHVDIVRKLISNISDINGKDKNGKTPLHHAAGAGQIDVIKLLIQSGSNIDAVHIFGGTPLHTAAYNAVREGRQN